MAKDKNDFALRNKHWDEQDLLISQAAVLHYALDLPKKVVAERLGVPASKVTSLMNEAKRLRLVEFRFRMPSHYVLSGKLLALFPDHIKKPRAIVVANALASDSDDSYVMVGLAANDYLEKVVSDKSRLTIDGGKTVSEVVEALRSRRFKDIEVFPVAGGLPHSPHTSPDALVSRIAGKYGKRSGLKPHFFPAFQEDREEHSSRLKSEGERLIREASKAGVFVLGVGVPDRSSTLWNIVEDMGDTPESLANSGITGVFGYTAFDAEGNTVPWKLGERLFKVPDKEFKKAASSGNRRVILVAIGHTKVRAIQALLKGGWVNTLITDQATAEAMLEE